MLNESRVARRAGRSCRPLACRACGRGSLHLQVDGAAAAVNVARADACSCSAPGTGSDTKPFLGCTAESVALCCQSQALAGAPACGRQISCGSAPWGLREAGRLGAILAGAAAVAASCCCCMLLQHACKHAFSLTCHAVGMHNCMQEWHDDEVTGSLMAIADEMGLGYADSLPHCMHGPWADQQNGSTSIQGPKYATAVCHLCSLSRDVSLNPVLGPSAGRRCRCSRWCGQR